MTPRKPPIVFVGPTLPRADAERLLPEAEFRPPAVRGDVLRGALDNPSALCLIDGYFEHQLAVHHKEVLWALRQGIPVCGAASMGALRAAELDDFGMLGSGVIYQAFADQVLENDDEVAVAHSPEPDFVPMSDALVNIRATLQRAVERGVIAPEFQAGLLGVASNIFYPERTYPGLMAAARAQGMNAAACSTLATWLQVPENRVNQKRLDAEELLLKMRTGLSNGTWTVPPLDWEFPESSAWIRLWQEVTSSRE